MSAEPASETVLFAGLGRMRQPMANHLRARGVPVCGFDPAPEARERFAAAGGTVAETLAEGLSRARTVLVMVGTEAQAAGLLEGPDGVLRHAAPGTLVVVISTMAPTTVQALATRAAQRDIHVLDAPVCRAEAGAASGTLLALAAGAEDDFRRAEPILRAFSSDVVYLGDRLGSAQVAKTVNNLILWACVAANDEGLRLARRWGIDDDRLRAVLQDSTADNWSLRHWQSAREWRWSIKDMQIAIDMADDLDVSVPLTGVLSQLVRDIQVLTHAGRHRAAGHTHQERGEY